MKKLSEKKSNDRTTINILCAYFMIFAFFSTKTEASPIVNPLLTNYGGLNYYVLVSTLTDSRSLALRGSYTPAGVYFFPKTVTQDYEVLDGGKTLRMHFPRPAMYTSSADSSDVDFPPGCELLDLPSLGDQVELVIKPSFMHLLMTLEPDATIIYRNENSPGEMSNVKLSEFTTKQFLAATLNCFRFQKNAYLTIIRTTPFTDSEIKTILQSFETQIHDVITNIVPLNVAFNFPDQKIWLTDDVQSPISFYHAFDLIDRGLSPLLKKDANGAAMDSALGESNWKRDFLNQAIDHYFITDNSSQGMASSCNSYQVNFRSTLKNEAFQKKFFQPQTETLTLPFVSNKI